MSLSFYYHSLRRDISNFSLLKNRNHAGFMVSMHQSGTHWLKHMLACAITHKLNLPPPRYSHANDIICGVRERPQYDGLPNLVSTHSIPHVLLYSGLLRRAARFPPYLILVRDIRASLVSNYEKWKDQYQCDFSTFLRGDVSGHRFDSDIWWCIRFCNAWGAIAEKFPRGSLIVRYEDLQKDTLPQLQQINKFWSLGLGEADLRHGIESSGKDKMAAKKDPDTELGLTVVRRDERPPQQWFDRTQQTFFIDTCARYLKYSFGYDYTDFS